MTTITDPEALPSGRDTVHVPAASATVPHWRAGTTFAGSTDRTSDLSDPATGRVTKKQALAWWLDPSHGGLHLGCPQASEHRPERGRYRRVRLTVVRIGWVGTSSPSFTLAPMRGKPGESSDDTGTESRSRTARRRRLPR